MTVVAGEAPGLGNPWKLTPGQIMAHYERIGERAQMADPDNRVGAHLKRMKRRKRYKRG